MTAFEIREKLKDRKLTVVAENLGIKYGRLRRWSFGNETQLSIEELRRLIEYLRK